MTRHELWRALDEWLRHRLRAVRLKKWKRGPTTYRALRSLGAGAQLAQHIAGSTRRWWHSSAIGLNRVFTVTHFDRLGVPRLC